MSDISNLLKIRLFNQRTGEKFNLLGFQAIGDDRSGFHIDTMHLYDVENRQLRIVNSRLDMKNYTIITE